MEWDTGEGGTERQTDEGGEREGEAQREKEKGERETRLCGPPIPSVGSILYPLFRFLSDRGHDATGEVVPWDEARGTEGLCGHESPDCPEKRNS